MTVHRHLIEHDHLVDGIHHEIPLDQLVGSTLRSTAIIVDLAGVEPAGVAVGRVDIRCALIRDYDWVTVKSARAHALRILAACEAIERETP